MYSQPEYQDYFISNIILYCSLEKKIYDEIKKKSNYILSFLLKHSTLPTRTIENVKYETIIAILGYNLTDTKQKITVSAKILK
jgi:hypothetical protein